MEYLIELARSYGHNGAGEDLAERAPAMRIADYMKMLEGKVEDVKAYAKEYCPLSVRVEVDELQSSLWIRTPHCNGRVDLRPDTSPLALAPFFCVSSGAALTGSLEDVEEGIESYRTIVDCLCWLRQELGEIRVETGR